MLRSTSVHIHKAIFVLMASWMVLRPANAGTQTALSAEPSQTAVLDFTGCYEIKLGRWIPWSYGEDTPVVTPPKKIELLPNRGLEGLEKDRLLIRSLPAQQTVGRPPLHGSFWAVLPNRKAQLTWTNGFSGVTLKVGKHGTDLHGWAHPHFDFPRLVPRTAHVTAKKIDCGIPKDRGGATG